MMGDCIWWVGPSSRAVECLHGTWCSRETVAGCWAMRRPELRRADVAQAIGNPRAKFAGWEAVIPQASADGCSPESLSAFVYDLEGGCRYRLPSAVRQGEPPGQAEDEEQRLASYRRWLAALTAPSPEPSPAWYKRLRNFVQAYLRSRSGRRSLRAFASHVSPPNSRRRFLDRSPPIYWRKELC